MPVDTQFYLSAIDHLRDPARNTRWRVLVPGAIFSDTGYQNTNAENLFEDTDAETDDFSLHVKTCKIPDITLTQLPHDYMGFKSFFVTNAKIDADLSFETIFLEDARAYEALLAWHQACINTGLLKIGDNLADAFTDASGLKLGLGHHKDDETTRVLRNTNVKVEMYNWYTGEVILRVNLINAVPTSVTGWDLNYLDGGLIKFNFTLHCDRWTVTVTTKGGNDANTL